MQVQFENYVYKPKGNVFSKNTFERISIPNKMINELDLNKLKTKAMSPESGYGWSPEECHVNGELYRVFLYLCWKYPNQHIVPPKNVDDFWHLHILDTRSYHEDCKNIFGDYLHHFPYAGLEGASVDEETEEKMKMDTLALVKLEFPELV